MSIRNYTKVLPAIYVGKTNNLYTVKEAADTLIIEHKDDIVADNGEKHDVIPGKGAVCNQISNLLFREIDDNAARAATHLYDRNTDGRFGAISDCETAVEKNDPIKLDVVVHNIATGDILKRLPFENKQKLDPPTIELYYKEGNRFLNMSEAVALHIIDADTSEIIIDYALEANQILQETFAECVITLVDMKLEFGLDNNDCVTIIGEISPDTCRLWDSETGESLDRDLYRNGSSLEDVLAAYRKVLQRLEKYLSVDD